MKKCVKFQQPKNPETGVTTPNQRCQRCQKTRGDHGSVARPRKGRATFPLGVSW